MADLFTLFGTIAVNADAANRTIDNTTVKAGGLARKFDSVGNSTVSLGKKIKSAIVTAGIAKAITSLTKASIGAYANYEQLVGGVETLFGAGGLSLEEYAASVGKSVEKVQEKYNSLMSAQTAVFTNAQQAYRTAGLSANEYMETATSFSASLVSSLKGNTEEAARLTDMAVTDMADNSNKMGTSMGSIQNAYQGFAKQNYTMLDNLKLGYGGTKKEMQRLLKDAQKISGQKYNIKNFDDVIEAIHVIQEEMGITGTTAEEAANTISGSWNSTKSAWENLMVGLSDGGADIDELYANLESSAGNVVKNVAKVIPTLAKNVVRVVGNLLQTAGQKISDGWENTVYPAIRDKLKVKFGIELPDWETIKTTITTKWAEVKAAFDEGGLSKAFSVLLPDWDTLATSISEGWNNIIWPVVQGIFKTAFHVDLPSWATLVTDISNGWNNVVWPGIQGFFTQTFGVELPDWATIVENISDGWNNTILPGIQSFFSMVFNVELPDWETLKSDAVTKLTELSSSITSIFQGICSGIQTAIQSVVDAWNALMELLGLGDSGATGVHESTDGITHGGGAGKSFGENTKEVPVVAAEGSEGTMQSEIDGYDLEGEALVGADPGSGLEIQSYLNTLNLTATVKLKVDDSALSAYDGKHKSGLDRVPFDGYRALLHKDEMVLTASQAAAYRRGQTTFDSTANRMRKTSASSDQPITVNLTVNGVSSNPYEIAGEVRNALELLRWQG